MIVYRHKPTTEENEKDSEKKRRRKCLGPDLKFWFVFWLAWTVATLIAIAEYLKVVP